MERAVAVKKLRKLLGDKLGYRVDPKAPSSDEREAAQAALRPAIEERDALEQKCSARRKAILDADAEYQSLLAASRAAREHVGKLSSLTRHFKFTVGMARGMFFEVRAEGDSWEQVIAKLSPTSTKESQL